MSVSDRQIRAAIQQVELFPGIADLRRRPRDYLNTVLNLVRDESRSYTPSRDEKLEAWLLMLLSESDSPKLVIANAVSDAVSETLAPFLDSDFPGRKVET